MKVCSKCLESKPVEEFYRKQGSRLSSSCKTCDKSQVIAYRAAHLDYYRQIDKNRAMKPHRIAARDRWAAKFPERFQARHIVKNAVKAGLLERLPCLICGARAQAHHPDYSAPLEVVWLCDPHHKQAHALARTL